ncbi:MAG: hypothetical protein CL912_28845 [Deltaproteobacteria bacterium]|nr:hypothetical protein [Deltaproteobacteria bacterium]
MSTSQKEFISSVCGEFADGSDALDSACSWCLFSLEARIREPWVPPFAPAFDRLYSIAPKELDLEFAMQFLGIVSASLQQEDCELSGVVDNLFNKLDLSWLLEYALSLNNLHLLQVDGLV